MIFTTVKLRLRVKPLSRNQPLLDQSIPFFIARLCRIRSAVIFKVQLAVPRRYEALGLRNILVKLPEKLNPARELNIRQPGQLIQHMRVVNHFARDTAAAVAVTVRNQHITADVFVREPTPCPEYRFGCDYAVVCGAVIVSRAPGVRRRDKIRQYLAAVYAAPYEQVMGHTVILVPAYFRSHESFNIGKL